MRVYTLIWPKKLANCLLQFGEQRHERPKLLFPQCRSHGCLCVLPQRIGHVESLPSLTCHLRDPLASILAWREGNQVTTSYQLQIFAHRRAVKTSHPGKLGNADRFSQPDVVQQGKLSQLQPTRSKKPIVVLSDHLRSTAQIDANAFIRHV